jgi:hypothetical protein
MSGGWVQRLFSAQGNIGCLVGMCAASDPGASAGEPSRLGCEAAAVRHDQIDRTDAYHRRSFDHVELVFSCVSVPSSPLALLVTTSGDPQASFRASPSWGFRTLSFWESE